MLPGLHRARFDDLAPRDLHDVLALRTRVFVVEQECAFQEIDGLDPVAEHVWVRDAAGALVASLRVLDEGAGVVRLGRIVTAPEVRGTGVGAELVGIVLADVEGPVVLGAQVRALGFYARFGFVVDGPEYDEDGIPHVPMRRPAARPVPTEGHLRSE